MLLIMSVIAFFLINNDQCYCLSRWSSRVRPPLPVFRFLRNIMFLLCPHCFNNNKTFSHLSLTSSHLHPLQVENRDSNSRLVVDEDSNGEFRLDCLLEAFHLRNTPEKNISVFYMYIFLQILWNELLSIVYQLANRWRRSQNVNNISSDCKLCLLSCVLEKNTE